MLAVMTTRETRMSRWAGTRSTAELIGGGAVWAGLGALVWWVAWSRAAGGGLEDQPATAGKALVVVVPVIVTAWGAITGRSRGGLAFYKAALCFLLGSVLALVLWYAMLLTVVLLWAAS
jgi:hypothetical protein